MHKLSPLLVSTYLLKIRDKYIGVLDGRDSLLQNTMYKGKRYQFIENLL